jgi:hypothetical protein
MYPRHGYLILHLSIAKTRGGRMLPKRMLRQLKCRDPLKWISFCALMNFGNERESLTAEIRNFIIRPNVNCKKQTNKPSQNSRVNAPSAASAIKDLDRQRF